MTRSGLAELADAAQADPQLRAQLAAARDPQEIADIATRYGFPVAAADVRDSGVLADGDLDPISGGFTVQTLSPCPLTIYGIDCR